MGWLSVVVSRRINAVPIGYMNGLKDAEKNERFGDVEDTPNNGNVAT